MKNLRPLLYITIATLLASQSIGCRKRKPSEARGEITTQEPGGTTASAVVVDPPKNLPPTSKPLPRPPSKPWGEKSQHERIVQIDYWLNQHQFGDAAQKSKVAGEIRTAGLSPVDMKNLEDTRKRFGYAPLNL